MERSPESQKALDDAINSLNDEDLKKFRLSRGEWVEGLLRLEEIGIYPDADPRSEFYENKN